MSSSSVILKSETWSELILCFPCSPPGTPGVDHRWLPKGKHPMQIRTTGSYYTNDSTVLFGRRNCPVECYSFTQWGWVVTHVEKDYPGSYVQNALEQDLLDNWWHHLNMTLREDVKVCPAFVSVPRKEQSCFVLSDILISTHSTLCRETAQMSLFSVSNCFCLIFYFSLASWIRKHTFLLFVYPIIWDWACVNFHCSRGRAGSKLFFLYRR